ncbi:MAG: DNA primase [Sphingobacteriaceae bacterium]|nr:DNA primase [Sphingobacteriaceae bacterium]
MIPKDTIDKINEACRVEEVIGEFVTLKKRGANLLGLCPFHGEKTPSFTVSPVKGIYKCFGCSKAGNTVNFVMDHLQLSYPEALKWLANKYGIPVVEKEFTPEEKEKQTERESLLIVMNYAQRYFTEMMNETDEGKSIGLGYFLERGLSEKIIDKFQLGYSPDEKHAFSGAAVKAGYLPKYLAATGMSILSNSYVEGNEITEKDIFDRYSGRVMFPIHDDGGRVVAFGGRTLSSEKKVAKYINSPETPIYNKSKILYGLWFGKKSIQQNDSCYLVEGYMDVIAMHLAGIENVVASSGTSLTVEQIKSIHRFTKNIVVLYDGDEAGQKASNRAIPLLLEEGMNVKLLMFPDNDDPDSFSRKVSNEEFKNYLQTQTQDFLIFKARKLSTETKNDPIKKAGVIKDLVSSIALIPDNIIRSIYVKDCSVIMEIEESILQLEVNKIRRKNAGKENYKESSNEKETQLSPEEIIQEATNLKTAELNFDIEERELLRLMILNGNVLIKAKAENEAGEISEMEVALAEYIIFDLSLSEVGFDNPIHQTVLDVYIAEMIKDYFPKVSFFANHPDPLISSFTINHVLNEEKLSDKWLTHGILIPREIHLLSKSVMHLLLSFKEKRLMKHIQEVLEKLKNLSEEENVSYLEELNRLTILKKAINKELGRIVIK